MSEHTISSTCVPWGAEWCKKRSFLLMILNLMMIYYLLGSAVFCFLRYRALAGNMGTTMLRAIVPELLYKLKILKFIFQFIKNLPILYLRLLMVYTNKIIFDIFAKIFIFIPKFSKFFNLKLQNCDITIANLLQKLQFTIDVDYNYYPTYFYRGKNNLFRNLYNLISNSKLFIILLIIFMEFIFYKNNEDITIIVILQFLKNKLNKGFKMMILSSEHIKTCTKGILVRVVQISTCYIRKKSKYLKKQAPKQMNKILLRMYTWSRRYFHKKKKKNKKRKRNCKFRKLISLNNY